ncbi:MAG: ATP-dependent DNA helicase, partial [Spirochaetota bacterium]|nr:ATP-dependent DNA helicase [Spirochaetota bacterium]
MSQSIYDLLKNYFGYERFRPLQEEIIQNILDQKNCLVLMPTGGGKSLCYQLPALYNSGITLVISPLISLMKDQVDALKANGINAEKINSGQSFDDNARIKSQAKNGKLNLLYVSPERLSIASFRQFLMSLNITLIAIDEAHCISEWGHDFRPDYRNLSSLRQDFQDVPILALTATATKKVRQDIVNHLNIPEGNIFISSFNRKNLSYKVLQKGSAKSNFNKLRALLSQHSGESCIIYCFSRKEADNLAKDLCEHGFNALSYHAGLSDTERKINQEKFIRDEVLIITATIAFGMGIDKPDVRLVVHYSLAKSLEGYYQETGRAGRDGLASDCVIFYSYGDKHKQEYFIDQIEDKEEQN